VDGVAKVQEKACFACGMCASECPMNAIQVKSYSDESLSAQVRQAAGKPGSLVAFCCKNSAINAHEAARKLELPIADHLEIVELPCAGKLDMELILEALTGGADGVLALGCHPGNCQSEKGSVFAKRRVAEIHRMLEAIGIEKERLHIATVAGNMGSAFYKIVSRMEETLKKLGPSSLRK
jgi:coenzyme F420-reducing hydrogenase delta subunit